MGHRSHVRQIELTPEPWTVEAEADLAPAYPSGALATVRDLAGDVTSGRAFLFGVHGDGERLGSVACRVDQFPEGVELVVVAAGARRAIPGAPLTPTVLGGLEALAANAGFGVRVHTSRPGLVRVLERMGYDAGERVLRKKGAGHGQQVQ